jgi:hypothetical protein
MNSSQFPSQNQSNGITSTAAIVAAKNDINYPVVISFSLFLLVGIPIISILLKRCKLNKSNQTNAQRQILERIWKARSGKPQR